VVRIVALIIWRSTVACAYGARVGFVYRRRVRLGRGSWLNLSKSGASLSRRVGTVTFNSRGGGRIRLAKGLSFRFGKRR
jgi:uncharacterized protein DUF4236